MVSSGVYVIDIDKYAYIQMIEAPTDCDNYVDRSHFYADEYIRDFHLLLLF